MVAPPPFRDFTPLPRPPPKTRPAVVLAVPTTTTPAELIKFCGPYRKHISHVRVLRDAAPNRYMAVLEFRAQDSCDDFYKGAPPPICGHALSGRGVRWAAARCRPSIFCLRVFYLYTLVVWLAENNNRAFNSLEPELVHLGFVASMEVVTREAMEAPFVGTGTADDDGVPAQIELPSCPVCLERMDASVMGVITILCQHSFHSDCLAKYELPPVVVVAFGGDKGWSCKRFLYFLFKVGGVEGRETLSTVGYLPPLPPPTCYSTCCRCPGLADGVTIRVRSAVTASVHRRLPTSVSRATPATRSGSV